MIEELLQPSMAMDPFVEEEDDHQARDLPAPYPRTDEEEESTYHAYADALKDERYEALAGERAQWYQNMLFAEGHQWWDYKDGRYVFPSGPSWKSYPVRNRIHPYLRMITAKMTKNRPQTSCLPASSDDKDIAAARLADKVLEAKWHELDQTARVREMIAWAAVTGSAWVMPHWNTDTGKMVPLTTMVPVTQIDPQTGFETTELVEAPCDEDGQPIMNGPEFDLEAEPAYIDEGDVGLRVFGPHRVFPDRSADTEGDIRSVVIVEPMEVRDVVARWPEMRGAGLSATATTTELDTIPTYVDGERPIGGGDIAMSGQGRGAAQYADVLFYYERPSKEWPHGRSWVTVDDRLLQAPGALPDGIWPVVYLLKDMDVPGRLLGKANMTAGIGLQREYNESTQVINQHHKLFMKGVWLLPASTGLGKADFDVRDPGATIKYNGLQKPEMVDLKALPHKVYEERAVIAEDFNSALGVHRASQGRPDPGVTSGRAFLALQEADDSDLAPMTERLEMMIAKIGNHTLKLIKMHYEDERTVKYVGRNNVYQFAAFKGADLEGVSDVIPVVGSAYPWSKSAQLSNTMEVMERLPMLMISPDTGQIDNDRVRRALSLGVEDVVDRGFEKDHAEVQREHLRFQEWEPQTPDDLGVPPAVPMQWQNHAVHIQQHGALMKDSEFEGWPPFKRKAMMDHYQVHMAMLEATMAAMAEQQTAAGGEGSSSQQGLPPTQGPVLHSSETTSGGTS